MSCIKCIDGITNGTGTVMWAHINFCLCSRGRQAAKEDELDKLLKGTLNSVPTYEDLMKLSIDLDKDRQCKGTGRMVLPVKQVRSLPFAPYKKGEDHE